ncbi:MAG: glycerol-3-phosphate 1-O-acyltransferase PlsY [Oscillospiraceae bacterium]|nr:glycerol-3-phosphate 1-O-acyltransferase PlsY [Oscillospiraceae bacterium]
MVWICYLIMLVVPYLLGGINTSIIVTKIKTGKDIRTMGSGNAGLTNTLRTQGKAAAAAVLLGDVAKSVIAVLIVRFAFGLIAGVQTYDVESGMKWVEYMAGFMAMAGHIFPVYYGFKGGKGVLSAISGIFIIDWRSACILLSVFIVIVAITRYVSLGSCISSALFCVTATLFGYFADSDPSFLVNGFIALFMGGLIIVMHHANIKRLLNHTEKKLGEKSK